MTENKLTRRDAMKLLGAVVGGAALANLPAKWRTPEVISGVLPAHAQGSLAACASIVRTVNVGTYALGEPFRYYAFVEGPITELEWSACPPVSLTITWDGDPAPGDEDTRVQLAHFAFPGGNVDYLTGSPTIITDQLLWSEIRPYNGIWIFIIGQTLDWDAGLMTFTFIS